MTDDERSENSEFTDRIQRSFWVSKAIWDAADGLPLSRTAIISSALLNAVTAYKSDLVQLKLEAEELLQKREKLDARLSVVQARIKELEAQETEEQEQITKIEVNKMQAVVELMRLLEEHGNKLMPLQYERLEELSGIRKSKIKAFLEETQYIPTEEETLTFFNI